MMTKTVEFKDVAIGKTFSVAYGEHGQKRDTFRKADFNMGKSLDGDWPMPFLLNEKVEIECPNGEPATGAVAGTGTGMGDE